MRLRLPGAPAENGRVLSRFRKPAGEELKEGWYQAQPPRQMAPIRNGLRLAM